MSKMFVRNEVKDSKTNRQAGKPPKYFVEKLKASVAEATRNIWPIYNRP
jgi:hypothetical protein